MSIENFYKLPDEKQGVILRSALDEFSAYHYDAASTNRIVGNAGISKGVLFKYFSSKEELFHFVVETYFSRLRDRYTEIIEPEDPFDYIERIIILENELYAGDEEMRGFYTILSRVVNHAEHPVYRKVNERWLAFIQDYLDVCCSKVDPLTLRKEITPEDFRNILEIFFSGLRSWVRKLPVSWLQSGSTANTEIGVVLSVIKKGLYENS